MIQAIRIPLITLGGIVCMIIIAVVFIKIMINTTKSANKKEK